MSSQLNPHLLTIYRIFSRVAGVIVLVVGVLVLAGWLFSIPALKSILPGLATMKANTALAFLLAGISLWLASTKRKNEWIDHIANVCAMSIILISLLTLSEYIFGRDLGIDQLFFKDPLTPENAFPGRMSPVTAVNFSLLGFSLLLLDRQHHRWLLDIFAITALLISMLALMGYAYGVSYLYHFSPFSPVAIHTALAFSISCLGILFARPEQGIMKIFIGENIGGVMARRLVPAALVLPFLLGWLLLAGQRMGFYDSTFRLVLYTLSTIIAFTLLIWWNASLLQNADLVRQQVQLQLGQSKEREAAILHAALDAVITMDSQGRILEFNPAAQNIFGYNQVEVLGREMSELIIPPSVRQQHRQGLAKFLATGIGPVLGKRIELTAMRADGTEFPVELTIIPITGSEQPIFTSFVRDITDRKMAEKELHKNALRTQALADISHTLAAARLDYQAVLDATARHITEMIGDACVIRLVSDDGQLLELVSLYHPEPSTLAFLRELLAVTPVRTDTGLGAQVIQTERPVIIPLVSPEQLKTMVPATAWTLLEHVSIHSLLVVPLIAQGKVLGTLTMTRDQPDRAYTTKDQLFLQDLADRAALSIANARLYTAMQQLNSQLEQRVTERTAALSQANTLLQTLLDYMPDHIYFKDSQSRFIRNSRSQAHALGLSDPAEAEGKSDFDFFPHAQLSYEKEQEIMRSGEPLVDQEEWVVWPDGRETWVSTTKVPLINPEGQIVGTFGISRDITERKRAEIALERTRLEMESTNKELEAFSYSVSHDLRAPLRTIDGFSQALLEDYADQLPPEGLDYLQRVRAAAQRMAELIDDLLNLSRVTRAPMQPVSVNLSNLADNIINELQRTHPERKVTMNIAPNLTADGDPRLLKIVLENLLNNAWKYSSKRQQAVIAFGSKYENNETLYFVQDNGAGFDMTFADKLFGAFQRLHANTEFPGTGIGLATVQRIIHRHGGRIWAESAIGQGATFFFTLPILELPNS